MIWAARHPAPEELFQPSGPVPSWSSCSGIDVGQALNVERRSICTACGGTPRISRHFPLLAMQVFPTDPRFVPAGTLLVRFAGPLVRPFRLHRVSIADRAD